MIEIPKISVIVPVYNVEEYLPKCLESIMAQSFKDFELLLIDDGTPDRSGVICDEYAKRDSRIMVVHQKNLGVSAARNRGMEIARGNYVVFVDSDDWVEANYLKDLYDALPDYLLRGLVIEGLKKIYPDGAVEYIPLEETFFSKSEIYRILTEQIDRALGYPSAKLYNLSLIREKGISFSTEISLLEDQIFLLDYICHADFVLIESMYNYCYRIGHSSVSLSVSKNSFEKECVLIRIYNERIFSFKRQYNLNDIQLYKAWRSLASLFHRPIISLYFSLYEYKYKDRINNLRKLVTENRNLIAFYFFPDYKIDKITKYLLLHEWYSLCDFWMRFWVMIKSKHMFGMTK